MFTRAMKLFETVLTKLVEAASDSNWSFKNAEADAALKEVAELTNRHKLITSRVFLCHYPGFS